MRHVAQRTEPGKLSRRWGFESLRGIFGSRALRPIGAHRHKNFLTVTSARVHEKPPPLVEGGGVGRFDSDFSCVGWTLFFAGHVSGRLTLYLVAPADERSVGHRPALHPLNRRPRRQ